MTTTTDLIEMAFTAAGVPSPVTDQQTKALSWLKFMTESWTVQGITVSFDDIVADVELNESEGSSSAIVSNLAVLLVLNLDLTVSNAKFTNLDTAAMRDLAMLKKVFPPAED